MIRFPAMGWNQTILGIAPQVPGNVGQIQNIFAIDDNSCALFLWDGGTAGRAWICYVIDAPTLSITRYASPLSNAQLNGPVIPFGSGNFLIPMNDGTSYFLQARNLKLNNPSPILVFPSTSGVFQTECYNNITKVFYDAQKQIISVASYYPNGGAGYGPVFSSNYSVNARTGFVSLIGQSGYAGWYTTNPSRDPWDRTASTSLGNTQTLSNGLTYSMGGNPFKVARQGYRVTLGGIGTTGCGAPVFDGTGIPSGNYVDNYSGTIFNTGVALSFNGFTDSNIPGLGGVVDNNAYYGMHVFGDNGLWFFVPYLYGSGTSCALTKNYIFVVIVYQGMSLGIINAPAGIYNGSVVTRNKFGLTNFVRPVSVIGKYKA